MYGYIYMTTNLINGKSYIGQHKYEGESLDPYYFGSGIIISEALKKYGKSNFEVKILEWCETKDELSNAEMSWIEKYDAANNDSFYNIDTGRGNTHEYSCSEETSAKLRLAQLG